MEKPGVMSGATLKKIAVITMLTDHIGAAFFYIFTSAYDGSAAFAGADAVYQILRIIGRTSFPIFCFLLAEGFIHTRSRWKYMGRLLVFALVSEIPFDLAFYDKACDMAMQNVFLTLALGLLALCFICRGEQVYEQPVPIRIVGGVLSFLGAAGCCVAAELMRTDYGAAGVALIVILYLLRRNRPLACMTGYVFMGICAGQPWCFPAFLFVIPSYNGEKGRGYKYFFYVFYPAHLLVLAGIRILCLKWLY